MNTTITANWDEAGDFDAPITQEAIVEIVDCGYLKNKEGQTIEPLSIKFDLKIIQGAQPNKSFNIISGMKKKDGTPNGYTLDLIKKIVFAASGITLSGQTPFATQMVKGKKFKVKIVQSEYYSEKEQKKKTKAGLDKATIAALPATASPQQAPAQTQAAAESDIPFDASEVF